jgi:trans-aconitate 2-methyltransferase
MAADVWDPTTYLRFSDERGRPFSDLLSRVMAKEPAEVVDLGCGPGTLTVGLIDRWPGARIRGVDSSAEMIESAQALGSPVEFAVTDVRDWHPDPQVEVVLANAVFQWVPGHLDLLVRWAGELRSRAWLAFQVPGNFGAPSHTSIREVAERGPWADHALAGLRDPDSVLDAARYAAALTDAGCEVDAWETTYVHQLPATGAVHPVLAWVEGTALRPVRAALSDDDWNDFRTALTERLARLYPVHNGLVYFPFRRIFVVARVG